MTSIVTSMHREPGDEVSLGLPFGQPQATRVIAVSSGKGGVGKTNVVVNLAVALSRRGEDVMVLDGDLGLSNVNVLLGVKADYNLSHVLSGERSLDDIVIEAPDCIRVVPSASGAVSYTHLRAHET